MKTKIYITEHAKERIARRLGTRPDKHGKMARKALLSNERVPIKYAHRFIKQEGRVYRFFSGCVFIFDPKGPSGYALVTVVNPKMGDGLLEALDKNKKRVDQELSSEKLL